MQETFYQTAYAGDKLSDSGCTRLSIRQPMQEYLHQPADAGDYQAADAGVSLLDSGCRRISIRQRMQESLF